MDNPDASSDTSNPGGIFGKFRRSLETTARDPVSRTQLIKFCFVGILNTIVGYGAFFILVNYLYYLLALALAHIIGVIHSYLWNKYWIFRSGRTSLAEFVKFNVVYVFVFAANAVALYICVDLLSVDPRIAQLLILPVITVISFSGQKLWTFGAGRREH
ncbi:MULTISPECIES: GtrA family protein [unclassified Methanoregula]|uniref:GtrA family protein n=1 Tax=unclassified Methanoregula TaxID=2649730 RepID=UPI0009C53098|nr:MULTISPECIES: GtrA family protein [unclassified Methanoregula]OPX64339.1 MAG: GtrA-like protein [Methanoregula sp. PtaB.Bin085]OPY33536.1 MAG: GtrA-like protein [Methanoregula sp. PtaU1.Bin006]